jgi:hypothetical protein
MQISTTPWVCGLRLACLARRAFWIQRPPDALALADMALIMAAEVFLALPLLRSPSTPTT